MYLCGTGADKWRATNPNSKRYRQAQSECELRNEAKPLIYKTQLLLFMRSKHCATGSVVIKSITTVSAYLEDYSLEAIRSALSGCSFKFQEHVSFKLNSTTTTRPTYLCF